MDTTAVLLVTAVIAAATVTILILVATGKAGRDRREATMIERRAAYRAALVGTDADRNELLTVAAGHGPGLNDLVAVLTTSQQDVRDLQQLPNYAALHDDLIARTSRRDPVTRGTSVLLLNLLHDPDGVRAAARALQDRDSDVRLVAARALGLRHNDNAAQALIDGLRTRSLPWERLVERLVGPWALQPCLTALERECDSPHPDENVRTGLARALGLIGDPAAAPALHHLCAIGSHEERVSAVRALGHCGDASSLADLEVALVDPYPPLRTQAARAIGELGDPDGVSALRTAMTDPVWWVRSNAAEALGRLGPTGHRALEQVASGPDRFAAQRASEQLILLEHR